MPISNPFTITVKNAAGDVLSSPSVLYVVDDPSICTVNSATGDLTPVAAGTTTLRIRSGHAEAAVAITVAASQSAPNPTLGTVSPSSVPVDSHLVQLTISGLDFPADATLVFSNTGVTVDDLTVSGDAKTITAHIDVVAGATANTGTVKVHSPTTGDSGTVAFTVAALAATSFAFVDPAPTFSSLGTTATLRARVLDQHGTPMADQSPYNITYVSSNTAVATVDSAGTVTSVGNGTATITAKATGFADITHTATVSQVVASITGVSSTLATDDASSGTFAPIAKDANNHAVNGATFTYVSHSNTVITVDANGNWAGQSAGSTTIDITSGSVTFTVSVTVSASTPAATAPASVTPSNVTARGATLTIAAPSDVATNPVTSYNIYRNGNFITNVAYSGTSQTYNASYVNSPPGKMDTGGESSWTWSVSAVRNGVESALTASAATLVPIDGWRGDDTPTSGVIWSDTFQYANVAALNTAYGTSYVDGTDAAIDTIVTYNGQPTVKMFGSKRPPKTVDFHTTPLSDMFIRAVTLRSPAYAITGAKLLYDIHFDDGGTSLEAYNAGGDGGNRILMYLNGGQIEVVVQAKTSGGTAVAGLTSNTNVLGGTVTNTLRNDRRFWALGLRVTAIANGVRIRYYERVEGKTTFTGSGWQLLYDHSYTDAAVTGTVQIKEAVFANSNDNPDATNAEWFARREIVDMTTNPTPYVDALPTSVTAYVDPPDPSPAPMGVLSFGPNGISSSTNFFTAVPINTDADFRALWAPADSSIVYSGNTAKKGTAASTNSLVTHSMVNADLMDIDTATTYTSRDGTTKHTLHMKVVPSYFSDTNPFLSDGVTLNPANDMCPNSSHMPEVNFAIPGGRSIRSWYVEREGIKLKNGWNMAAGQNTKSVTDYGNWTVISGGTGVAQLSGVTTVDQLKGMVFRVISGTGDSTATDTGHFYMAIDTCDASGNITYHGYNGVKTYTIDSTSVLHLVGFNFTQSSACKLGPHPSSDLTRADLEMSNSTATLDSGNMTGTVGSASARFNGGTDNNYTIGLLTSIFGANWATDEQFRQLAIAFKVTGPTTATLKVWAGLQSDPTLTLKYSANVTFNSGDYAYMKFCNWTGKNFNRQLAATDPVPELWVGQTKLADMEEAGWTWPSYIPVADQF